MALSTNGPFADQNDQAFTGLFRPTLLSMIPRVSDEEIMQAFASTTVCADQSADESPASVTASLRSLSIQNNVLFRMIIHSRHFQKSSGMLFSCYLLVCDCHTSLRCDFANRCDFELIFVFVVVSWIVSALYLR